MGPGLNPQHTGAPKAGGGCGLLAKSTTTSPMAQPQCGNVNMVAEQFRSTARSVRAGQRAVRAARTVEAESEQSEQCRWDDTKLKLKADDETVKVVMISESLTS